MSDGSRLRQSWYSALNDAETHFRQLLTSPANQWKRLSSSNDAASSKQKGKARVSSTVPEITDVIVHRNSTQAGDDVYRLVLDVPTGDEQVSLEPWRAVLTTPELRQEWDPSVDEAHLLEMFDHDTRISKTNYTLGWPANPRDAITISRSFSDTTTFIDISTSLPRSSDEPAYLRPSPPFVRSHVKLLAWCIQHIQPYPSPSGDSKNSISGRLRLTCFCQHDLRALWGFGYSISTLTQQLSTMTLSLLKTVMKRGSRVPKLTGYGNGVSIGRIRYQLDREALTVDYTIFPDDEDHSSDGGLQGMDEVHAMRENRRLTRTVECVLPSLSGWDVQITMKGSDEDVEKLPWSAHALRSGDSSNRGPMVNTFPLSNQILFRLTHSSLTSTNAVLKVKLVIEVAGGTRGLRLNGLAKPIHSIEERDPSSVAIPQRILQDMASVQGLSFGTSDSAASDSTVGSSSSSLSSLDTGVGRPLTMERSAAAEKTILSKVRRNYIYFSSLLQEPEAKWRRTTEARGVSITQLDSIDPTLVVYRAEATFVGVGLWDLYGAVVSPGARVYWDKQHEDGALLEDVNELTELWHFKTKPAWPVNGRDSVVLKTVYKSPTTIHVFSFSADDLHLFPHIPPVELNVIRTQVDLQGWAIEALSPTTTSLTLLEQSDPKGWTNKTSIPTQMIGTLAGIGEFAIKCGGPPVVTRMAGAKANEMRYDHDRGSFKVEYEPSVKRMAKITSSSGGDDEEVDSGLPAIECELRCDIDTWAGSLDIVVDPPPQSITCLRRHRLSTEGGGLWLTLTHDAIFVDDPRLLTLVRKAPGKEKGLVMVNGARIQVDVEELGENEIKTMMKQKRVKPVRIPLDQPPVMGAIRRQRAEWGGASGSCTAGEADVAKKDETEKEKEKENVSSGNGGGLSTWASAPKMSSPLARFLTYAVDQATTTTQQAVAAISPASGASGAAELDSTKMPMQYVLEALAWTQQFNIQLQSAAGQEGWTTLVNEKGLLVQKKVIPEISPFIPVHKGVKVIEGVSAEELAEVIMEFDCRKTWDDRYDSARVLESYGGSARTTFVVAKAGFPFRDRGFCLANVTARAYVPASSSPSLSRRNTGGIGSSSSIGTGNDSGNGGVGEVTDHPTSLSSTTSRNAIFCVSASFSPDSPSMRSFSAEKYNPYVLPIGRVYLDAWILETLDPYTKENYAIPSTRCTRLVAVDFRGSIPAAVNGMINVGMARGVIGVEAYMKKASSDADGATKANAAVAVPITRLPTPGMVLSEKRGEDAHVPSAMVVGVVAPFMAWKLRKRDENRMLVETRFDVENKIYKATVLVGMGGSCRDAPTTTTTTNLTNEVAASKAKAVDDNGETTPRSSRVVLNSSPRTTDSNPFSQLSNNDSALMSTSSSTGTIKTSQTHSGLPVPGSMIISSSFPSFGSTSASTTLSSASTTTTLTPSTSSNSGSTAPQNRQRTASSGSGSHNLLHNRTTSSAFTVKGEVKPLMDLVAAEVVIDSKLYGAAGAGSAEVGTMGSGGVGYCVEVKAWKRDGKAIPLLVPGSLGTGVPVDASAKAISGDAASTSEVPASSTPGEDLPFIYTIHTMPSSPLHSSGLHAGSPSRHLLRVTLPTAQYRVMTVREDPLTGEARSARPRPAWVEELEKEGGGWVVGIDIRPSSNVKGKNGVSKKSQRMVVLVNGKEVMVLGEKESLTNLGRDELLDDRVGKMGVLSRTPNESEPLPSELKEPIAIADDLLYPPPLIGDSSIVAIGSQTRELEESKTSSEDGEETGGKPKIEVLVHSVGGGPHVSHAGSGGLLGLWQTYGPNPLTRFAGVGGGISVGGASVPGGLSDMKSSTTILGSAHEESPPISGDGNDEAQQNGTTKLYPLSTVLLVGLIAFLIGSLLRSLLSPADFIYVVTDLREAEEANNVGGWREIRRLLEIKYLVGGWDFQVAVVRRQ